MPFELFRHRDRTAPTPGGGGAPGTSVPGTSVPSIAPFQAFTEDRRIVGRVRVEGRLSDTLGWPLIADSRAGGWGGEGYPIRHYDAILAAASSPALLPEVVVVAGEVPASRPLGSWLQRCREAGGEILHLVERGGYRDPLALSTQFAFAAIGATAAAAAARRARCLEPALFAIEREVDAWLESELASFSEPGLVRHLHRSLRAGEVLFASSSMPIRYLDNFGGHGAARVLANRGVNGIDGVVASFLGAAEANRAPSVLVTGDLALLYDLLALRQLPLPEGAAILVLDNRGGVIFDRVPPAAVIPGPVNERLFVTPHQSDIPALLAAAGIGQIPVTSTASVDQLIEIARGGGFAVGVAAFDREATGIELDRLYSGAAQVVRRLEAL